ncbi:MAG: hypothetical protein QM677_06545 [Microbacterium sp.]
MTGARTPEAHPPPEPEEESELEQTTRWLQRLTGDPMADAVPGRLTVLSASEPAGRGRYQECRLELRAEAEGIRADIVFRGVFDRRRWPRPGIVAPARIARSDPREFEANWSVL